MENIITIIDKQNNAYRTVFDKTDRNVYDLLDCLVGIRNFIYQKNSEWNDYQKGKITFATTFIIIST